jgi:hypothetical protein
MPALRAEEELLTGVSTKRLHTLVWLATGSKAKADDALSDRIAAEMRAGIKVDF